MAAVWFGWVCPGFGSHSWAPVMRALASLSQQGVCFRGPGQVEAWADDAHRAICVTEPSSNLNHIDALNLNHLRRRGSLHLPFIDEGNEAQAGWTTVLKSHSSS